MSASIRKFVPRAPRYTLRPSDNSFMRFAQKGELGHSHITRFVDISMTGLAFITERDTAPFLFEMIKIEVPLADGEQIAWWAKVVRVEEYAPHKWYLRKSAEIDESKVLVAVKYHDLPLGHLQKIKRTLDLKFVELEREKVKERFRTIAHLWSEYTWQVLVYGALILGTFGLLWYLAQPGENYDAQKGAPWGQRYQGFFGSGSPEQKFEPSETGIIPRRKSSPEIE